MPWNGSGDFSLSDTIAPATNADANELQAILTDIGVGIDASVAANGESSITGAIKFADGTAPLPALTYVADLDSGFYRIGANNIGLSLGGTKRIDFGTAGTAITGTFDATSYVSPKVVLSSDAGATVGPTVDLFRDSASPAVSDFIGSVDFNGRDSGAAKQLYAEIIAQITDPTAASEDAIIILRAVVAGVLTDMLKTSAAGVVVPGTLDATGNFAVATSKFTVAAATGNTLAAGTLDATGNFAVNTNKLTVAAASGNIASAGSVLSSSPSGGIGYAAGAGGTVVQATSKATGVTLNTAVGTITMNGAALNTGTIVSFLLTNSTIAGTDLLLINHINTGTLGGYTINGRCGVGTASIDVRNNTGGSLSEALILQFAVFKGANS